MKNHFINLFLLVVTIFTITIGCQKKEENNNQIQKVEEKKLICSKTDKEDKYTKDYKYTFNFKNVDSFFDKVTIQDTIKYNGDKYNEKTYEKYSKECKTNLEKTNREGFTCNVQSSTSNIWITYQFIIANLNDYSKKLAKEYNIIEINDKKIDEIKSTYEEKNYNCQVK